MPAPPIQKAQIVDIDEIRPPLQMHGKKSQRGHPPAIGQLASKIERQREVALLSWGEGLAAGEIAAALEITEANVYATLHAARKRLAKTLGVDYARSDKP